MFSKLSYLWWFWTRPKVVRDTIRKAPPSQTYLLKPTKQVVHIVSYYEDGTVKVYVLDATWQPFTYGVWDDGYEVFGYKPEDLEVFRSN